MVHFTKPGKHADFKKNEARQPGPVKDNEAIRLLLAGAIAGCITKTATAPLERVKILQQLHSLQSPQSTGGNPGDGLLGMIC